MFAETGWEAAGGLAVSVGAPAMERLTECPEGSAPTSGERPKSKGKKLQLPPCCSQRATYIRVRPVLDKLGHMVSRQSPGIQIWMFNSGTSIQSELSSPIYCVHNNLTAWT